MDLTKRLLDQKNPLRIHLIGVAGSGMSGLALLLLEMGHQVSGCDRVTSGETQRLQEQGLRFHSPQTAACIGEAEVVVYSSAIRQTNPALAAALERGLHCIKRAQCLAAILATKKGVVVSGTHGKTTTSALCAHLLRDVKNEPSHYVGAEIPVLGANAHWNSNGDYLVAEGDESDGTLALYQAEHSIILNIEEEHLDHYEGLEDILEVFQTLISQTRGSIIYCANCPTTQALCSSLEHTISYGWPDSGADFVADRLSEGRGVTSFDLYYQGEKLSRLELGIPGRHNVLNALAAIALVHLVSGDLSKIARALSSFAGARRRFETKHLTPTHRIIDDYGHHPTEIEATLQTAHSLKPQRLIVVFQPHRYSRTKRLAEEFGAAFQAADLVIVTPIYAASEDPLPGVSEQLIVEKIQAHPEAPNAIGVSSLEEARLQVGNRLQKGDLLLTLGAGNVHEVGTKIARDLTVLDELSLYTSWEDSQATLYEPLKRHTTFLIGGPAQYWFEPTTFEALAAIVEFCKSRGIPVRLLGRGSNLLIRDGGIRGAVVYLKQGVFSELSHPEPNQISAGAGVRLKKLASEAQKLGLGGFEWMEGIPGNVGGSLRMNAGAMGVEMFDQVIELTVLTEEGEVRTLSQEEIQSECQVQYRQVPFLRRNYALKAIFSGQKEPAEVIQKRWKESREKRQKTQPKAASAGCIFKNPGGKTLADGSQVGLEGVTNGLRIGAGQLVEELGLKGYQIGKAKISLEHGNFIVNTKGARARDVLALIEHIRSKAREDRQIELDTEVQILGEETLSF